MSHFTAEQLEELKGLIREEAIKLITDELTIDCDWVPGYYGSGDSIDVVLKLENEKISGSSFGLPGTSTSSPY